MKDSLQSAGKTTGVIALVLIYIASLTAYFDYVISREVSAWIQIPVTLAMIPITWIVIKTTNNYFSNLFNNPKN